MFESKLPSLINIFSWCNGAWWDWSGAVGTLVAVVSSNDVYVNIFSALGIPYQIRFYIGDKMLTVLKLQRDV